MVYFFLQQPGFSPKFCKPLGGFKLNKDKCLYSEMERNPQAVWHKFALVVFSLWSVCIGSSDKLQFAETTQILLFYEIMSVFVILSSRGLFFDLIQ